MAKEKTKEEQRQEELEERVSRTEQFYNENKKIIWGVLCAVVVIILAVLAYGKFIYTPKCAEAQEQTYPAENNFQQENYELALNGDGNVLGFADIIKEYGNKAGKAVYLYAGICELKLNNYKEAADYLKKYTGKEPILAGRALSCLGDAYVGLEDYTKAAATYMKAAETSENIFAGTYLLKAGSVYEQLGQKDKALACYEKIKNYYPASIEAVEIEKYIQRVK